MASTNKLVFTDLNLPEEEIEKLTSKKTLLNYSKSENLLKQDAFANHVLYIVDGLVKIYITSENDKALNLRVASTGDFLGFSAVFGNETYSYSAQAITNTQVCMIDKIALKQLLSRNPMFAYQLTEKHASEEQQLIEVLKNISYKQMRGKLASAIIYLSERTEPNGEIFPYLTRNDIADFAAITTESAIRFLKEFDRDGIIELKGKQINISNPIALQTICDKG